MLLVEYYIICKAYQRLYKVGTYSANLHASVIAGSFRVVIIRK